MSHMIWVIWYDSYPEYYWPSLSWVVNLVKNFVFRPKMTDNQPIRWTPLESNPDVFNSYMAKLGVPASWVSYHQPKTTIFKLDFSNSTMSLDLILNYWWWFHSHALHLFYYFQSLKKLKSSGKFSKTLVSNFKRLVSFFMLGNFEYIKGMNKKKV